MRIGSLRFFWCFSHNFFKWSIFFLQCWSWSNFIRSGSIKLKLQHISCRYLIRYSLLKSQILSSVASTEVILEQLPLHILLDCIDVLQTCFFQVGFDFWGGFLRRKMSQLSKSVEYGIWRTCGMSCLAYNYYTDANLVVCEDDNTQFHSKHCGGEWKQYNLDRVNRLFVRRGVTLYSFTSIL